jgi:hypothetical protein
LTSRGKGRLQQCRGDWGCDGAMLRMSNGDGTMLRMSKAVTRFRSASVPKEICAARRPRARALSAHPALGWAGTRGDARGVGGGAGADV